jgi:hypothetical protein
VRQVIWNQSKDIFGDRAGKILFAIVGGPNPKSTHLASKLLVDYASQTRRGEARQASRKRPLNHAEQLSNGSLQIEVFKTNLQFQLKFIGL